MENHHFNGKSTISVVIFIKSPHEFPDPAPSSEASEAPMRSIKMQATSSFHLSLRTDSATEVTSSHT